MEKKYWINTNGKDHVWYCAKTKEDTFIKDCRAGSVCFAGITYGAQPENIQTLIVQCPKAHMGYAEPEIIRWVNYLNEAGFWCSYKGEEAEIFKFEIDFLKYEGNRLRLNSTLNLLRYLWIGLASGVVDQTLQILDENPEKDFFIVMQEAHDFKNFAREYFDPLLKSYMSINSNHCIKWRFNLKTADDDISIISKEDFEENLKVSPSFYKSTNVSVLSSWDKRQTPNSILF